MVCFSGPHVCYFGAAQKLFLLLLNVSVLFQPAAILTKLLGPLASLVSEFQLHQCGYFSSRIFCELKVTTSPTLLLGDHHAFWFREKNIHNVLTHPSWELVVNAESILEAECRRKEIQNKKG